MHAKGLHRDHGESVSVVGASERSLMLVAGEPSGDAMAAGLVSALKGPLGQQENLSFWGAGGEAMENAGVEVLIPLAKHGVFGFFEVIQHVLKLRRWMQQLVDHAIARRPKVIVLTDYAGFNLRFAKSLRKAIRRSKGSWNPYILYYVSPQVWASRADRVYTLESNVDCLLSLFHFEKKWYHLRAPGFRVEYVGDPMRAKYQDLFPEADKALSTPPSMVLLPGSRQGELKRHLPILREVLEHVQRRVVKVDCCMILTNQEHLEAAKGLLGSLPGLRFQEGGLSQALEQADLAIACSGTVTRECAYHGVPTVVFYRLSWFTYQLARKLVQVKYISMPNIMLNREVFPEYIQQEACGEKIAGKVLEMLQSASMRQEVRDALAELMVEPATQRGFHQAAKVTLEYLQR